MGGIVENQDSATLSRAELYALIWAQPLKVVAERFGTSGARLGQICDAHNIPRPDQGHWLRLELGKPVRVHPLPTVPTDHADVVTISPRSRRTKPEESGTASASGTTRSSALEVPARLARPHPLVAGWIAARERQVREKENVYDSRLKRHVKPVPHTAMERRRLLVADTVFKAVEKRGVSVSIGERLVLLMTLGTERIEFQIRYRLKRGRRSLTADELRWRGADAQTWKCELNETDSLVFEIKTWLPRGLRTGWEDSKRGRIEDQLDEIVDSIMAAFPVLEEQRRQREEEKRRWEQTAREQYRREEEARLELARFRKLLEHAAGWREIGFARAFIVALREAMPPDSPVIAGHDIEVWLSWADRKLEQHDMVASDPRSIFESIASVTSWTYRD
jgi:hypothetical protein